MTMKLVRLVVLLCPFSNRMGEEAVGAVTKERDDAAIEIGFY